ncbi:MAG: transposase [Planctomycetes bacterium]|nr:transposase [Planctomycetota bacterium]
MFNGKFRDEWLDMEWFRARREAIVMIEQYRQQHNDGRPHSSLGYRTHQEFKKLLPPTPQTAALAS